MKKCAKCEVTKEDSEFYSRGRNRKDLAPYCKPCFSRVQMKRWKEAKVKAVEYKGNKCIDCNITFERPEVYQFHHLDPQHKNVSWDRLRLRSWDKIVKELDKCVLLCSNCHIIRHSKELSDYD